MIKFFSDRSLEVYFIGWKSRNIMFMTRSIQVTVDNNTGWDYYHMFVDNSIDLSEGPERIQSYKSFAFDLLKELAK